MNPSDFPLIPIFIFVGGIVAWLGRTWISLITCYLIIGAITVSVLILGGEVQNLASDGLSYSEIEDIPLSRSLLVAVDVRPLADAVKVVPEFDRDVVVVSAMYLVGFVLTLPFVVCSNHILATIERNHAAKLLARAEYDRNAAAAQPDQISSGKSIFTAAEEVPGTE